MALERKSELVNVGLSFVGDAFRARVTWRVGAWDTATKEWVGLPEEHDETLLSPDQDHMKRFNDALGVLTSECVRRTVAAQQRMADMIVENDKIRASVLAEEKANMVAEGLLAARLGDIATLISERNALRERNADLWSKLTREENSRRSWLYRLTLGVFGS